MRKHTLEFLVKGEISTLILERLNRFLNLAVLLVLDYICIFHFKMLYIIF